MKTVLWTFLLLCIATAIILISMVFESYKAEISTPLTTEDYDINDEFVVNKSEISTPLTTEDYDINDEFVMNKSEIVPTKMCYWKSNYDGKWVARPGLNFSQCKSRNECVLSEETKSGMSGGACYKWARSKDSGDVETWVDVDKKGVVNYLRYNEFWQ